MASDPKPLLGRGPRQAVPARRIAQLANLPAMREAQLWLGRERGWINRTHLELCRIPAATFFESERALWCRGRFESLGWRARLDRAGNVLARFGGAPAPDLSHPPALIVSAHLDTVFAPARPQDVIASEGRFTGPGVSDNGSGLTALFVLARLLAEHSELHELAAQVLLVGNVGEEGEGNLSGMRYLCEQITGGQTGAAGAIRAFVVLDGPSTDHITAQALASRRFEVLFAGPGGHSWNDYGRPNPVHALGDLVSYFVQAAQARVAAERKIRCAFNFGVIEGGASINAIPASARAKLDLRSESPAMLDELAALLGTAVERSLERENQTVAGTRLSARIRELGARPGGRLPEGAPLLESIQAVDAYLNIRSRVQCASTDANVPLSLGLPAISIGSGGQGGGAHTPDEWYQADGRELGLLRVLLLLADIGWPAVGGNPAFDLPAG